MSKKIDMAYTRELIVTTIKGEKKVKVPAEAKMTFGPAVPYHKNSNYEDSRHGYSLRVYLGNKENLIAIFTGVLEFRYADMPVATLVVEEAGKKIWKSSEEGYTVEESVKKKKKWEKQAVLALESGNEEDF